MKINESTYRMRVFALLVAIVCYPSANYADGIPEPGLVIYGSVTNANGGFLLGQGNVQWIISGGGSSVTVNSTIANVNGQYFYIARIPFETRSVSGGTFTPAPNTLP